MSTQGQGAAVLEQQGPQRSGQRLCRQQGPARLLLCQVPYAQTRVEAECLRCHLADWCRRRGYDQASTTLGEITGVLREVFGEADREPVLASSSM